MNKISVFALAFALVFASCKPETVEGPAGKDGKDGIAGKDGKDGATGKDGENGKDASSGTIDFSKFLAKSKTPNFLKLTSDFSSTATVTPLLSSEDTIPGSPKFVYGSMADGNGMIKNQDGSFTLINNIEADYSVARITLNKDLKPVHGEYILNATATAFTAQCSGSMITPEEHGFGPLYLSGGEWGGASKGVFVTNPFRFVNESSVGRMLNAFGQWSTENAVVIGKDAYPEHTVAFIGDDHADSNVPSGQLGMYVGLRGDLERGKLYGLKVKGHPHEATMVEGTEYEMEFVELKEKELNSLDKEAKDAEVTGFSRVEDIDWRKGAATNQREVYFCVTGRAKDALKGKGSFLGRVYKLVLNAEDPTKAGKITCILDGDKEGGKADGFHSPDNIVVTENYAYIQEDPNGYASLNADIKGFAKLYQYDLKTGNVKTVAECDQTAAESKGYGQASRYWEITGMVDITDITKSSKSQFLVITQNHGWESSNARKFTDPKANPASNSTKEGSVLHLIEGLPR